MKINEVTQSIIQKKYVFIEDPVNGTIATKGNSKMINSYIIVDNGVEKMRKIVSLESKEDNGIYIVINDSITIPLDPSNDIFVLRRVYYDIPDSARKVLTEKYRVPNENIEKLNIYTPNIIPMESITNKIFQGKYPYFDYEINYVGDEYKANVYTWYNSDVCIKRLMNSFSGNNITDVLINTLYFMNSDVINGPISTLLDESDPCRVFVDQFFLELQDIEDTIFVMKDLLTNQILLFDATGISSLLKSGVFVSKEFVYAKYADNDATENLYNYFNSTQEEKAKFNKDQLLNDYEYIIGDVDDAKLIIFNKDSYAAFFSKSEFMTAESAQIEDNKQTEE